MAAVTHLGKLKAPLALVSAPPVKTRKGTLGLALYMSILQLFLLLNKLLLMKIFLQVLCLHSFLLTLHWFKCEDWVAFPFYIVLP